SGQVEDVGQDLGGLERAGQRAGIDGGELEVEFLQPPGRLRRFLPPLGRQRAIFFGDAGRAVGHRRTVTEEDRVHRMSPRITRRRSASSDAARTNFPDSSFDSAWMRARNRESGAGAFPFLIALAACFSKTTRSCHSPASSWMRPSTLTTRAK